MKNALEYFLIFSILYFLIYICGKKANKDLTVEIPLSLDYSYVAKGVAIAIVIYGHLGNLFKIRYLTPLGGIGVAMFLILSGYGMNESWKRKGGSGYWTSRFVNMLFPYIIIEFVTIPMRGGGYTSFLQVLLDLTGLNPQYYLGWYIPYLLFWYTVYFVTKKFVSRLELRYLLWIITGIIIVSMYSMVRARQALSFVIGIVFSDFNGIQIWLKKKTCNTALLFIIGIVLLCIKQIPEFRQTPKLIQNILEMLLAISFSLAIILSISLVPHKLLLPFYYLGIISYELYLIHGYTLLMVNLTFWNAIYFYIITIALSTIAHLFISLIQSKLKFVFLRKAKV